MTYGDRLRKRWVVVRLLPKMQHVDVGHFFKYTDAQGYAEILRRLTPGDRFEVMFETSAVENAASRTIADVVLQCGRDRSFELEERE
jgi:hypothetical protein